MSDDHVWVDGTLVEAWASLKSFRAKDGSDEPPSPGRNGERDFDGEKRANDTHESTTDPDWARGGALLKQKIQALLKVSSFALRASMAGLAMVETPGRARTLSNNSSIDGRAAATRAANAVLPAAGN